ncbi:hypothetical protein ACFWM1_18770 [Nocardia sp. NPDC058379]|uniref:hypothetical protein n=1 Tax=unclassified Nocardia TaxID=2637762 RepID=UPI0036506581
MFDAVRSVLIAMADSPVGAITDTALVYSPEQSSAMRYTDGRDRLELEIHVNTRSAPGFSMRGDLVGGGDPETVVGKLRTGDISDFPPDVVDDIALFDFWRTGAAAVPSAVTSQKDADDICAVVFGSTGEGSPHAGGFVDFVRATYGLDRTGIPAESPTFNCPGDVSDYRDVNHPALGALRVSLVGFRSNTSMSDGNACIAVTKPDGVEVKTIPMSAYKGAMYFHPTSLDATGNLFVVYNPGRYDGILVIVPTDDGVTTVDRYNARLIGPGTNGQFTIESKHHDCTPDCAHGPTTTEIQHWNGTDYVP